MRKSKKKSLIKKKHPKSDWKQNTKTALKVSAIILPLLALYAVIYDPLKPDGEVWPCCILGYSQSLQYLRGHDYNFKAVWHSKQASRAREYIKAGNCACPLAKQAYSNILCNPKYLFKTIFTMYRLIY